MWKSRLPWGPLEPPLYLCWATSSPPLCPWVPYPLYHPPPQLEYMLQPSHLLIFSQKSNHACCLVGWQLPKTFERLYRECPYCEWLWLSSVSLAGPLIPTGELSVRQGCLPKPSLVVVGRKTIYYSYITHILSKYMKFNMRPYGAIMKY